MTSEIMGVNVKQRGSEGAQHIEEQKLKLEARSLKLEALLHVVAWGGGLMIHRCACA